MAIRKLTDCRWVLLYVERWLKTPVQMEDGSIVPGTAGTLANLLMHYSFDIWMARTYPHIPFVCYADNAICHCGSVEEAPELWRALADRLAACKLVPHRRRRRSSIARMRTSRATFPSSRSIFLATSFVPGRRCGGKERGVSSRTASNRPPAQKG